MAINFKWSMKTTPGGRLRRRKIGWLFLTVYVVTEGLFRSRWCLGIDTVPPAFIPGLMPRWGSCGVVLADTWTRKQRILARHLFSHLKRVSLSLSGGNLIHNSAHDCGFPRGLIVMHDLASGAWRKRASERAIPRVVISTRAFTCPDYEARTPYCRRRDVET